MARSRMPYWVPTAVLVLIGLMLGTSAGVGLGSAGAPSAHANLPRYDHIFLIILENNGYHQIIGNPYAPVLNALARDYGIASNYHGVADPSEPNYVAMLGGSFFGITNDNPYWYPGNTVHSTNLMSQLNGAGKSWRAYLQGMPYPGYRGYCYPDKCNGIPDADTQYVTKHNGIVNFADMQTPAQFAKLYPFSQLSSDLASGNVPNFSYIVPDECDDMHGAPPWCVDSGVPGTVQQDWLISQGDRFVHDTVNEITASSTWGTGKDAIVVTFDEGNQATSRIMTIVVTNHGPRGLVDNALLNHYSLLLSIEQAFGLGCLRSACNATAMGPLFASSGSTGTPTLPKPFAFPVGSDPIQPEGFATPGASVSLGGITNWTKVPSVTLTKLDNVLAGVSAASATDAWAVGTYYPKAQAGVLATLGEHFDGTRWTAYPLPNVGVEENTLMGVSMPGPGKAWAVGYYIDGNFEQRTLVEHFNGTTWSVVPSPDPSATHDILYGVSAITDSNVWAVGAEVDAQGTWQTLAEHWDGSRWSVVGSVNPGFYGDQLYAVTALGPNDVVAVGQQSGSGFPSAALIEHWNGARWSALPSPADASATALPLGVGGNASALVVVGQQETDISGYTPYVAAGAPHALALAAAPSSTSIENDLFGVTILRNGSAWAVGWAVYKAGAGIHVPLILDENRGVWSLATSPTFGPGSDTGLEAIAAIPGGGVWAVGYTSTSSGSPTTLIEYHP